MHKQNKKLSQFFLKNTDKNTTFRCEQSKQQQQIINKLNDFIQLIYEMTILTTYNKFVLCDKFALLCG